MFDFIKRLFRANFTKKAAAPVDKYEMLQEALKRKASLDDIRSICYKG